MSVRLGWLCACALVWFGSSVSAFASSSGIVGFSGNPATQLGDHCILCHSGGVAPTVQLAGPTTVKAGATSLYTLTIGSGSLAQDHAGLDVSATDGVLTAVEAGTQTMTNPIGQAEVTHTAPRAADTNGRTTFRFNWTAPMTAGTVTLYAAGNSVDNAQGANGDASSTTAMQVTVEGASATPGETSGPSLSPLLVNDYDTGTGNLTMAYDSGCNATQNTIHYGTLSSVATHDWSGSDCAIGTSGAYATFNPGPGSYFFVVVGKDGVVEGSYGKANPGGGPVERPDYMGNACGQSQDLIDVCAGP